MQKCLIFLLALFSLTVQAHANWNPYSMDHERFVHLSDDEKRTVIIRTMEFMVELEAGYKKNLKTTGYSPERYQKYVQALLKLQNILISSANTANDKDLKQLASGFGGLLDTLGSDGCVYGGYVSKMATTSAGDQYCQHPSMIPLKGRNGKVDAKAKAVKDAYLDSSNDSTCAGPSRITCNPVIFGYDKVGSTSPFCVDTGHLKSGKAHNVSYECMKKALSGSEEDQKAHLDVVVDGMKQSPETFKKVHNFIFTTCACGKTSINKDYANYIKPHRTCYGMMNSLRVMKNNECEVLDNVKSSEFPDEWARYFGKQVNFPELTPSKKDEFDMSYESLIDKDAVKAICSDIDKGEEKKFKCDATCEPETPAEGAQESWKCTITKAEWTFTKGSQSKVVAAEMSSTEFLVESKEPASKIVQLKDGTEQSCDFTIKDAPVEKACTPTIADDETDPNKSKVTITFSGFGEKEKPEVQWPKGWTTTKEDPLTAIVAKTEVAQDLKLNYSVGGHITKEACIVAIPVIKKDESKKNYTIEAKAEAPASDAAVTIKVNATVKLDGKDVTDMTGLLISWNRQGFVAGNPVAEKKPKKSAKVDDEIKTKEKTEEKKNTEGGSEVIVKKGEEAFKVGSDLSVDEQRTQTVYKTCATLLDANKKVLAGPACDDISPLKAPTPPPANLNNFPQGGQQGPPPLMAPQNNTRMLGIQ